MNNIEQLKQPKVLNKRYYIAYVLERIGDYEHNLYYKFATAFNPDEYIENVAKSWYEIAGEDGREEFHNGYLFNGGEVYIEAGGYHEVDKELYDRVPYLSEM